MNENELGMREEHQWSRMEEVHIYRFLTVPVIEGRLNEEGHITANVKITSSLSLHWSCHNLFCKKQILSTCNESLLEITFVPWWELLLSIHGATVLVEHATNLLEVRMEIMQDIQTYY